MEIEWTENLSVGNAVIDSDHRNLISLTNGLIRAIEAKDHRAMSKSVELIEGGLIAHFKNEERIARFVNFDFSEHKLEQQRSLKKFQAVRNDLLVRKGSWTQSVVEQSSHFLKKWVVDEHIANLDIVMKPALQAFDYKFWPCWKEGKINHTAGHIASLYLQISDRRR